MKVALVYDRLNKWGGAERVLIALSKLFPHATWYTSVWDPQAATFSRGWDVKTSWLNKIPLLRRHHDWIPFLMPFVFESFDFSGYDLVISISSEAAKGILTKPGTIHLNYCLTPTRYLWSHRLAYYNSSQFGIPQKIVRPFGGIIMDIMAKWDLVASARPDEMIAISTHVKNRIEKYYNRDSEVIFPPVDTKALQNSVSPCHCVTNYFLVVSRLVPYKNIETIVRAFSGIPQERLVIVGVGSELSKLKAMAGPNITFAGYVAENDLTGYYAGCQALVTANVEDFGLTMVEAQALGKPVIAPNRGGAADIVLHGQTGLLYDGAGVSALRSAIAQFASLEFDQTNCRRNAARFDIHIWEEKIKERVQALCQST